MAARNPDDKYPDTVGNILPAPVHVEIEAKFAKSPLQIRANIGVAHALNSLLVGQGERFKWHDDGVTWGQDKFSIRLDGADIHVGNTGVTINVASSPEGPRIFRVSSVWVGQWLVPIHAFVALWAPNCGARDRDATLRDLVDANDALALKCAELEAQVAHYVDVAATQQQEHQRAIADLNELLDITRHKLKQCRAASIAKPS